MSTEIVELVEQVTPYVSTAVTAYGAAVLSRAEEAAVGSAVEGTAGLGRRILQLLWRRREEGERAELERVVGEAADEQDDTYSAAVLGRLLRRALEDDPGLREELSAILPAPAAGPVTITASGERSIAAQHITTAITGDGHTPPRP